MRKFKKCTFIMFLNLLLLSSLLSGCADSNSSSDTTPVIYSMDASYVFDIDVKENVVGDADYVFAARIVSNDKTLYKFPVTIEDENGEPKEIGQPYTLYTVEVLDNIKGKLKKNSPIQLQKAGGIAEDGKSILIYENDSLMEVNQYYVLIGYAQKDGSILVTGANSSIILETNAKKDIVSSSIYNEYKNAVKNEVKTDRKNYKSKYDEE